MLRYSKMVIANVVQKIYHTVFYFGFCQCYLHLHRKLLSKKIPPRLYKNIETYSKRNKFNTFMYRLIFKPIAIISKKEIKKKTYKKLIQKPYSTFQGKIIRNINIVTLDPFGYSVTDTTTTSQELVN